MNYLYMKQFTTRATARRQRAARLRGAAVFSAVFAYIVYYALGVLAATGYGASALFGVN